MNRPHGTHLPETMLIDDGYGARVERELNPLGTGPCALCGVETEWFFVRRADSGDETLRRDNCCSLLCYQRLVKQRMGV